MFTLDQSNYPVDEMKDFVTNLHNNKQYYGKAINTLSFIKILYEAAMVLYSGNC